MHDAPQMAFQRAGPLAELPALLAARGTDPAQVLAPLGLTPDALAPDARLPINVFLGLLDRAARATALPHLGLVLGARHDHRSMGLIGRLMANAPTVRQALLDFVEWQAGQSKVAASYLIHLGDDAALGYGMIARAEAGAPHAYDLVVAMACNALRRLGGPEAAPIEVLLSHRAPADRRPYDEILRVPVRFDQDQTCVIVSRAALDLPIVGADPAERRRLLDAARAAVRASLNDTSARVRHALRPRLPLGLASQAETAAYLGLHPRTLGRRLAREGTTFEAVRDEVRQTLACELLALTDLPIGEVSEALSFASHSAFVHAFRRWSGASPSAWRAGARAAP